MASEHSPGPWRIERRVPFGISSPAIMKSDTDILCSMKPGVHIEADATLIAAAPDLLAACIEALELEGMKDRYTALGEQLRAAVAKASVASERSSV